MVIHSIFVYLVNLINLWYQFSCTIFFSFIYQLIWLQIIPILKCFFFSPPSASSQKFTLLLIAYR